jgi:DNA polymerase-3 subunit beta
MTTATKERKTRSGGTNLVWLAANLKAALAAVRDAVPGKTARPILHNVLFRDGLLTATDLEVQIETEWPSGDAPAMTLPFQRLASIVGLCRGDEEVSLRHTGTSVVVKAGHSEWTIPTEDAAEFPAMTPGELQPVARFPADQFARAVRSVVYATDVQSSRYALGAVLCEVKGDAVTLIATDGRRLSRVEMEHDLAVDDSQTLISHRALATIARLADAAGDEASVQLQASKSCLVAEIGGTTVTATLVEGRFPRWRDVFPSREATATVVDRAELLAATRAAAIVTTESSKGVDYAFSEDGIWLHGQSSESGESSVTCPIVEFGQAVTTKIDPRFVADFLNGLPADAEPNVEIEAVDAESAVVLRCGDCWGVIMPLAKDA